MNVIEKENLRENATRVGDYLLKTTEKLMEKHQVIGKQKKLNK